ncbi:MAG: 5-(carboxyamino)imidazole ribonucleotide mutase [Thermoplasmata archaeon]|jgi:5-(carboxyamino)imidazole ribonucleotide mutase|nr:5-(carboxyamino)imidazole ribonucleotide mutase [Thermoplasmata archaeon]
MNGKDALAGALAQQGKTQVAILMGSKSDWEVVKAARDALQSLGVPVEAKVLSAHRAPGPLHHYVEASPAKVFICAAGGAAHLAGVVASFTTRPVVALPIAGKALDGLDSLLAMVQMPKGVPVATVAINGAANAGLLAAQILAVADPALAKKLQDLRASEMQKVLAESLE